MKCKGAKVRKTFSCIKPWKYVSDISTKLHFVWAFDLIQTPVFLISVYWHESVTCYYRGEDRVSTWGLGDAFESRWSFLSWFQNLSLNPTKLLLQKWLWDTKKIAHGCPFPEHSTKCATYGSDLITAGFAHNSCLLPMPYSEAWSIWPLTAIMLLQCMLEDWYNISSLENILWCYHNQQHAFKEEYSTQHSIVPCYNTMIWICCF